MTLSEYLASSFDQKLIAAIHRHYLVLLLGPITAALLFYAINPELRGMYVSKAYVRLDRANAESLSLERASHAVADLLLGGLPEIKEKSTPARAFHLMNFMELVDAEPPGSTATERLYRLEMTHKDPAVAQSINRQMLEGWLANHPGFDRSIIVVAAPDLPTRTARTSRALAAVFAGIAAAAVLLFVAGWGTVVSQFAGMALRTGMAVGHDADHSRIQTMRLNFPVLGGASAVIVVFWVTVFALNQFIPLCPPGPAFELKAPFPKHGAGGAAYIAAAPLLKSDSDTSERPTRSAYLVCENRYALGPAHSLHMDISTKGKGRFSHWGPDGFIFSTLDNSDPNTNGRSYLATRRCDPVRAAGLCGSWTGEVSQGNPPATYPVEMQLYGNGGNIIYSSAGCGGKLEFLRTDGTSYWYQEHMSYGGDKCTDGGTVEMRALDNISWNWTWTGPDVSVTGVLRGAGVSLH